MSNTLRPLDPTVGGTVSRTSLGDVVRQDAPGEVRAGSVPTGCPHLAAMAAARQLVGEEAPDVSAIEQALSLRSCPLHAAGPAVGGPVRVALASVPAEVSAPALDPPLVHDFDFNALPHLQELHAVHGPVFRGETKLGPFLVTMRRDDLKSVLLNTDRGTHAFGKSSFQFHGLATVMGANNILLSDGHDWEKTHSIMNPKMDGRTMRTDAMTARMDGIIQRHIEAIKRRVAASPGGELQLDLRRELQTTTLDVALQLLTDTKLGDDELDKAQAAFRTISNWNNRETLHYSGGSLADKVPELKAAHDVVNALADRIMAHGAGQGTPIAALMAATDPDTGQPFSAQRVKNEILTLLLSGHETTTGLLSTTISHLARDPAEYAALQREADGVVGVPTCKQLSGQEQTGKILEDALRHDPPVYFLARQANQDTTMGPVGAEVPVPKGTTVIMSLMAAHRDEHDFGNPGLPAAEFHPQRESTGSKKFPFGAGVRVCIGQHMARLEAELMLTRFAQAFDIAGVPHPPLDMMTDISLHPTDATSAVKIRLR